MALKKDSLVFAGEMAIVSAVITIPIAVAMFVLDYFEGIVPKISNVIIMLISMGFFIFIYTRFRRLLNEHFQYDKTNTYITLLIVLTLLNFILNILYLFYDKETPVSKVAIGINLVLMVVYGIFLILFAFRLLDITHDLFGYRQYYSYAVMGCGACFALVICAYAGYVASAVSDVFLGLIFLRAAEQPTPEAIPEI